MRRYDIDDEENLKVNSEGEFVRYSDVLEVLADFRMLALDITRAVEELNARREIREDVQL